MSAAITVDGVWKNFRLYHERNRFIKAAILRGRRARYEEFWALNDVSFEIPHGATFGIVGSNGSGKSTMLKCLAGILFPDKGSITTKGRLAALLELGAGFHPELSGRENVFLNGAILGMTRKELDRRYSDIVEFAGIERFIDTPVRNYSNGMIVRLGFAIAAHVDPEILLIDEILSVGDQTFQRKSAEKIEEFKREGRTIVIVSHGLSQVQQLCENVAWLDHGILRAVGPAASVIAEYTGDTYEVQEASETSIGKRWGTGRVSISTIELLNKNNQPSEVFDNGTPLTIRVSYSSHAPINDLVVSIRISTLSGIDVWKGTSLNNGLAISKTLGSGMISMTIPQLPLLEGCYLVSVALTNPSESTEFDHWQDCYKFDVHQVDNLDEGIVAFPTTWRTD